MHRRTPYIPKSEDLEEYIVALTLLTVDLVTVNLPADIQII